MDDSEKRKEILKAMRMEATAAASQNNGSTSMNTVHLSNPLTETSTDQQEQNETPRFDYYTQPMSAYSSFNKNKTPKQQYMSSPSREFRSPVPPPHFPPPPPPPGTLGSDYQAHTNHGGFQAPHYGGENMHIGPRGMSHISPSQGSSSAAWDNNYRPQQVNHFRQPYPVPGPYPYPQESHVMGSNRFGGRGGGGNYNNAAPQFSNYGQQKQNSNWNGNRYPNSGRGRGRGRGMNRNFGGDGGLSAERLYSNSMAEDPWKYLKPVLWKSCSDGSSSSNNSTGRSWLPNSIAPKEPAIVSEPSHRPRSNQSLAEFLAESVDEATCNESGNSSEQLAE